MLSFMFVILVLVIYGILTLRYTFFKYDEINTLFIEDRNAPIRKDGRITLYEDPIISSPRKNFKERKLHRCFYNRILSCNLSQNTQTQVFVFQPNQSEYLYPSNVPMLFLKQTSEISVVNPDVNMFPSYKKATCIEIPISGLQALSIPKGWWVFVENPRHFNTIEI